MQMVELTDEEAKLFMLFRQHEATFRLLLDNHVFEAQTRQVIINFKPTGQVGTIDVKLQMYRSN